MRNPENCTVTIVEQTINGGKVISWAHGDATEGERLVDAAERQAPHWTGTKLDRVTVFDKSQIPEDSLFTLPAGGISSTGRFEIEELFLVRKSLAAGRPNTSN